MDIVKVTQLVGLFYTLPRRELAASRRAWVKEWKKTRISAAHFIVQRYGLEVAEDGSVVPMRAPALLVPLHWERSDGFGPHAAAAFVRDVRTGRVPATD